MDKVKIKGIMPPVITPFKENGDPDYESFASNIGRWNHDQLTGYLVLGSNGESAYLNEEEKLTLVKEAVQAADKDRIVMVGTGMESTRTTIDLTNKAAKLGADLALVLTPYFYGGLMTSAALIRYFTEVADHSDIPILIYNVPKFTHLNIKSDVLEALCSHPNIVGMKDSAGDVLQLAEFKRILPEEFNLIVGSASALFPALTFGIEAGILALANCNPNECGGVIRAFESGDLIKARAISQSIVPINTAITKTYGIPGLKYACELRGYAGGHVRKPLLEIGQEDKDAIKRIMKRQLESLPPMP